MFRVVLDTNLLIDSQLDDYHHASRIIDEVISGKLQAIANHKTLSENRLLVAKKITDKKILFKLETFFNKIVKLDNSYKSDSLKIRLEDDEDRKILQSGITGQADFLITSDKHLLNLEQVGEMKILTPSAFWAIYREETGAEWMDWLRDFINQ